ncbi:flagellar basal body rod protein [Neobacillus drentensis]|uniref:lmo0954 family membrane protein n=1 Tax=Neobacillus drentensis TaxID=220684 RepID=UPI001F387FF6|nr:flagellar basal body rod protein [Neobacillus drentensis]ULT57838.1 flagellar basal body rod protein [Neobacillus drentensis]
MKKFGLLLAGGIAAVILLSTIGPMVGLLVSVVLLYFIFKQFLKTKSIGGRIGLGIIGFIVLMASLHNAPAIIGVAAAYVLYLVYKKWNKGKVNKIHAADDPFINFEKQWNELKNY